MSINIPDRIQEVFRKPVGTRDRNDLTIVQKWVAESDQLRGLLSCAQKNLIGCKERAIVEDVVHEFFEKRLKSVIRGFKPEISKGDFVAHLKYCLKTFCWRKSKYLQKERNRTVSFSDQTAAEKFALESLPDDSARLPDEELFLKEIRTVIKKFLEELDSKYRAVFEKCYFEEKSIKEIADELGLSETNTKIRLFRVRQKIKRSLPVLTLYLQD